MDIKKLKGIAVLSIDGSEKLGQVEDIMIDSAQRQVGAFKIASGGLLKREHRWVPFAAVRSVGEDALMVQDDTALQRSYGDRATGYHDLARLGGLKVVTENGDHIGQVSTAHFDPASGAITEFEIGTGGLGGLLHSNKVISAGSVTNIGENIMIVPAAVVGATSSDSTS